MSDPNRPTTYTCYLAAFWFGMLDKVPDLDLDPTEQDAAALALGASDAKQLGKPRPMREVLRDVENLTRLPHVATEMEAAAEAHRKAGAVAAFKVLHEVVINRVGAGQTSSSFMSDAMMREMSSLGIEADDLD